MAKKRLRLGKLLPRYRFALNPYTHARFSKCPKCGRIMNLRKFPLLIHIAQSETFGLRVMGKTCRYCPKCEMIIVHKDELERAFAANNFENITDYLVIGTVKPLVWKKGMVEPIAIKEILEHAADFKQHLVLEREPARWVLPEKLENSIHT